MNNSRFLITAALVVLMTAAFAGASSKSGSPAKIDTSRFFPLSPGNWWQFEGEVTATGEEFKTKIAVENPEVLCGLKVFPLLFLKSETIGYWSPGADLNLRWFLADFDKKPSWPQIFLRGVGDKRYVRDPFNPQATGQFYSFVWYASASKNLPAYIIFPQKVVLGESLVGPTQTYPSVREDRRDCAWLSTVSSKTTERASWHLNYTMAYVATLAYVGEALKVDIIEDFGGRGWVENWYFAEDIGPVQIEVLAQGEQFNSGEIESQPIQYLLKLEAYYAVQRNSKNRPKKRH